MPATGVTIAARCAEVILGKTKPCVVEVSSSIFEALVGLASIPTVLFVKSPLITSPIFNSFVVVMAVAFKS